MYNLNYHIYLKQIELYLHKPYVSISIISFLLLLIFIILLKNRKRANEDKKLFDEVADKVMGTTEESIYLKEANSNLEKEVKKLKRENVNLLNRLNNQNRKTIGDKYEEYVMKEYQKEGYDVYDKGKKEGKKDGGIDLIATKGNKIRLIQCKYWKNKEIGHAHIKEFYGNCNLYIDKEDGEKRHVDRENVKFIYAIPNYDMLTVGARKIFEDTSNKCWYKIYDCKLN